MHTDIRKLENGAVLEADICIVGAGAAGISMALDLINSKYKVILLEGGGFEYDRDIQQLYEGKNIGQRYFPLQSARLHFFGGTTGHWAGWCSPLDPIDFKKREWVKYSGWPITIEDLQPYYKKAYKLVEIGTHEFDAEYWEKQDPRMKRLPIDENKVWSKMWQFSPPTRFGTKYKDEIVKAKNIHLYTYANVNNIECNETASEVKNLELKTLEGKTYTVRAKKYVMACGAIENARMLLASNKQAKKGLGNDNDVAGRYFMEHLEVKSADLYMPGNSSLRMYLLDFMKSKARAEFAVSEKLQEFHKILNGTGSITPKADAEKEQAAIDWFPEEADRTLDKMKEWEKLAKDTAKTASRKPSTSGYEVYEFFTRIEQSPNPDSRIQLTHEKDRMGVPKVTLDWKLTSLEKTSIRKLYEIIGQEMGRTSLGRVKLMDWLLDDDHTWPEFLGGGWHHMGTTRMHNNPKEGVVDANCKVHGVSNLYVAGASCYTTAGAANPTLTLIALSLRLSDYLKGGTES